MACLLVIWVRVWVFGVVEEECFEYDDRRELLESIVGSTFMRGNLNLIVVHVHHEMRWKLRLSVISSKI